MLLYGRTEESLGRRASNMEKPDSTSANDPANGGKGNSNGSNPIRSYNDFGKYIITAQSIIGASLVLGKQIQFSQKGKNTKRAVIHTAQWMKEDYSTKKFA